MEKKLPRHQNKENKPTRTPYGPPTVELTVISLGQISLREGLCPKAGA